MADETKYNILIECGADFVLPFTWYDSNGSPYDLTGATVTAQLREHEGASQCFEFVCTHNGAGGRITITLPSEVTNCISYSYGVYDVFVDLPKFGRRRPLHGDATIQDHVSKLIDGTFLYMIGVEKYDDLPTTGILNRLYFCYDDRKIFRWNGQNYVAIAVGNGIQSFVKFQTVGAQDIYRMTFDDGTYKDIVVTNSMVTSVTKIKSEGTYATGIIDTYRMTFSSGSYYDFEVTNGRIAYATFWVELDDGHMYMYTPELYPGPDFEIDEENGHIAVVVTIGGE